MVIDTGSQLVDATLLNRALDRAVIRGNNVFIELIEKESHLSGELDYIFNFRSKDQQFLPEFKILDSLRRRLIVIEENRRLRLRVPLMARWLRLCR